MKCCIKSNKTIEKNGIKINKLDKKNKKQGSWFFFDEFGDIALSCYYKNDSIIDPIVFYKNQDSTFIRYPKVNNSEMFLVMVGGMATVAGGVLAAYIGFLGGDDPVQRILFAKHLLTASIMAAPGAIVISKLLVPQTEEINKEITTRTDYESESYMTLLTELSDLKVKPTSMIDISDGLASEIMHICKSSDVGCHIYDEKIPIDAITSMTAIDFNLDPVTCALNGGEDYELLFTVKQSDFDKVKGNPHMTPIGHITHKNDGIYYVDKSGSAIELRAQGWNHFND